MTINYKNNDNNVKKTLKTLLMLSITSMMLILGGIIIPAHGNLLLTINNPTPEIGDSLGISIAGTINGNILVGATYDNTNASRAGSVYLFDGIDGRLLLTINNPTPEEGDAFGRSVAGTINDNIIVGTAEDNTGASDTGSVYLFDGSDGSLLLTINNPTPELNDHFGRSVDGTIDGNILVGASWDNTGADGTGSAYLFDGTTGELLLTINNPTPNPNDRFGESIAGTINGNILVGAYTDDAGSVYLFDGSDGSLLLTINNPIPEAGDYFGYSVDGTIDGNILVGAAKNNNNTGSAYLFDGTTGELLLTINNPTPNPNDRFGWSVAGTINGNILVGAYSDDTGADDTGSAYLFDGYDGSLLLTINNPIPELHDRFGWSVAGTINGNILVGAYRDSTGATSTGSVYLFDNMPSHLAPVITFLVSDDFDDQDNIYFTDDTITITFDSDTNTPGGMGIQQNKTAVNDLFTFTELLGEAYTGQWITVDTFVITITNATGASPPIIDTTTVTPTGITPILSSDETSSASTASSSPLEGDFGIYTQSSGALESGSNWWFETPSIPMDTQRIVINATFTNQDSFDRSLSFSADSPYQLWAYESDRAFVVIPEEAITILQKPTESVNYNSTFHYEIGIDVSALSDPVTLAFRVVTIEGGTMHPDAVPNNGSDDEVTFFAE